MLIAALCVVAALGASVTTPSASERTSVWGTLVGSMNAAVARVIEFSAGPDETPLPRLKREETAEVSEPAALPSASGVVAQCGYATLKAVGEEDGETLYRASFADSMLDEMAGKGCAQFYQGCNVCSVRYTGCDEAKRAACTDADCLAKVCERQVRCSAKRCTMQGKKPTCESRIARTSCRKMVSYGK